MGGNWKNRGQCTNLKFKDFFLHSEYSLLNPEFTSES